MNMFTAIIGIAVGIMLYRMNFPVWIAIGLLPPVIWAYIKLEREG